MPNPFQALSRQPLHAKIFLAIIALAILARLFILFTLPDAPLTDTLHHFTITKYIVQNMAIPFNGIPAEGVFEMSLPLYPVLTAIPFALFSIPFTLEAARAFPFIFSFLQLFLSFLLLRKMFPRHWHYGFALVAVQPFLMIFGALNYLETLASVFVLLSAFIYWRFAETGKKVFLLLMPFALAGMAISKESATILVAPLFLLFLFEIWKKRPARISKEWIAKLVFFSVASVMLCSVWFLVLFNATGSLSSSLTIGVAGLEEMQHQPFSLEQTLFFPLRFNERFWFFLPYVFSSSPFGISSEMAFVGFTFATFPVFLFLLYGLAKGLHAREKQSLLLLLCFAFASFLMLARGQRFIHARFLVPMMPLLGIALCTAFKNLKSQKQRRLVTFFFLLAALYSLAFSSIYALHFNEDYNNHVPLYEFAKQLPEGSKIAIHPNKTRQIAFISGKETVPFTEFKGVEPENLLSALRESQATHLAATCYRNPWDLETLEQLEQEGKLQPVFQDECSTVYELKG